MNQRPVKVIDLQPLLVVNNSGKFLNGANFWLAQSIIGDSICSFLT